MQDTQSSGHGLANWLVMLRVGELFAFRRKRLLDKNIGMWPCRHSEPFHATVTPMALVVFFHQGPAHTCFSSSRFWDGMSQEQGGMGPGEARGEGVLGT